MYVTLRTYNIYVCTRICSLCMYTYVQYVRSTLFISSILYFQSSDDKDLNLNYDLDLNRHQHKRATSIDVDNFPLTK